MHHQHHTHVLQLDIQGTPQAWIENFLLEGRHIRADVHEWLARAWPLGSRLS